MNRVRKLASTLRWRLKPVRWAGKAVYGIGDIGRRGLSLRQLPKRDAAITPLYEQFERDGYAKLPRSIMPPDIDLASLSGVAAGQSFIDVSSRFPDAMADVFSRVVNDPELSAVVLRYFNGRPWLWNAALNYSDPSRGLTDSQMWHFDYGDVRQLHIMVYFSDVGPTSGPFTFLRSELSDRIRRHPLLIERLTDADLAADYGISLPEQATRLFGTRGDVFLNDPGRLLHQGARCETSRLVLFISFTTPAPMSKGGRAVMPPDRRAALVRARQAGCVAGSLPDHVLV